jgi:NAD(P)-dependent dehydrogenase (short-subunit alcohol dehydrogenase family)
VASEREASVKVEPAGRGLDFRPVSWNPLRRLAEQITLTSMRPPLAGRLLSRSSSTRIDLAGKRVVLTGASSGIGECAAEQFARRGATVVAVARRKDLLDEVVGRITANGGDAIAIACDLSDLDAVDALVADVENRLGGVDILINNAGRSIRRPLAESLERWHDVDRTMVLNYYSPLRLIRGIAPGMLGRGDGHIINVATWGVFSEPSPLFAVYNASKAALSAVSRVIETEWATKGVHSTTLYYPLVATPMIAPTKEYQGLPALSSEEAAGWMITAARTRPVRIAPRMALAAQAIDTIVPGLATTAIRRQRLQPNNPDA